MSMDIRDEAIQKRCIPTPWQTGAKLMVVRTWQMDYLMAMRIQQIGIRPMLVGTWCSGDNLDTEATCSCQQKMTKTQRTWIKPMAAGPQLMESSPKVEANHYMRNTWRKGKVLKNVSGQWTDSGMMVVLQSMIKLMVGTEHQMTTCLQARSAPDGCVATDVNVEGCR